MGRRNKSEWHSISAEIKMLLGVKSQAITHSAFNKTEITFSDRPREMHIQIHLKLSISLTLSQKAPKIPIGKKRRGF